MIASSNRWPSSRPPIPVRMRALPSSLNRKSQYEDFEFEEKVEKTDSSGTGKPRREYPDYPPQPEQKVRPKDISYNDVDDDDFFSQFVSMNPIQGGTDDEKN